MLGAGNMDLGGLHRLPDEATRSKLNAAFAGTGYKLNWQPDMEAYLICHLPATTATTAPACAEG